ncbi:HPr family phosphocarrier protein [Candidatus Poribacteria bacterium]|nr:HPr family phosphocarrier protein [Candidatus Poribacteria bacterium]
MTQTVERTVDVRNSRGLHLHVASLLANAANQFESDVFFVKDGLRVNGKSVMSLTLLAATVGTSLLMVVEGTDAERAASALEALFASRFGVE